MGPGRRNQTLRLKGNEHFPTPENGSLTARNLVKSQLGGVIFGCKHNTMKECLSKQLFGLPHQHFSYVKKIDAGLPLFLFNYSDRKLHGIYEAAGPGKLNIDPYGWTSNGSERTPYPAQVQIRVRLHCQPLAEEKFRAAIADNYYNPYHFWFELDHVQTNTLICLLAAFAVGPSPPVIVPTRTSRSIYRAVPSNSKKENGEGFKLPALEANQSAQSSLVLASTDAEVKEEFKDLLVPEVENSTHSCRKSNSTEFASSFDVDDPTPETHLDVQIVEQKDRDLLLKKLKDLTLRQELQDACLTEDIEDSNTMNDKHLECDESLEEQTCVEVKNEESSRASSHFQAIILQLMDEMNELKTVGKAQTSKICYLEQKLVGAETEIQRLKARCTMLESMSNSSSEHVDEMVIKSKDDAPQLDPAESIFLLGGFDGESWLSSVHAYTPALDVVKAYSPMNTVRSYASAVRLVGEIYVFGGGDNNGWYDTAESYSPSNDRWTCCPSLSKKKGSLGGAALNGKIFAIGGGNGVQGLSDVEMLDLDVGRWIQTRSMLQKRFAVGAAELNGAIYAVGGYDGVDYLTTAERFDPREHSWMRIATMKSKRGCHSLVVLNEKLYAIGGFDGDTMVSSTEIYDPRAATWMTGDPINHPRGYSAAAVANDSIYVIGGLTSEEEISPNVERFKDGEGWQDITATSIGKS